MTPTDLVRPAPGGVTGRVTGHHGRSSVLCVSVISRTDVRRLSSGQGGVSREAPYLSSTTRETLPLQQEVSS